MAKINNMKIKPKHDPMKQYCRGGRGNHYKRVPIPPPEFALTKDEIEAITEENIGMVWSIVWKWCRRNGRAVDKDDMFQEAIYGWYYGSERYDKRKRSKEGLPVKPQSYMMNWAICYVRNYVRRMICRGFYVPHMHANGGIRLNRPVSLNYESPYGGSLSEIVAGRVEEEKPEFPDDFWERVNKFLSLNQRIAIDLRYRRGMTLQEIGNLMGVTREAVRLWEAEALRRIKLRVDFGSCVEER